MIHKLLYELCILMMIFVLQKFYEDVKTMKAKDVKKGRKKLEDWKSDPLKNISITCGSNEGRRKKKKKKKVKRLDKQVLSRSQKEAKAKQYAAAEVNRIRAIESQVARFTKAVPLPVTAPDQKTVKGMLLI